jgi:WD40 repeat protein
VREVVVRDAETWVQALTRKVPPLYGRNAVFANDSNSIVVCKKGGVALIKVPSGRKLKTDGPLASYPLALAVSPDVRWVATTLGVSTGGRMVHIGDAASGAEVPVMPQTAGKTLTTLTFSPAGRLLASAGFDAKVKIWDTETGLELLTLSGHKSWIWKMHFSPDGNRILWCRRDRTLRIWDATPILHEAARSP